jgi:hypothetical protein
MHRKSGALRGTLLAAAACLVAGALLGCGTDSSSQAADESQPAAVTADELRRDLEYLAADEREGRLVGTEGIAEAEEYIAQQFEEIGLEPLPGDNDYFEDFELTRWEYPVDRLSLQLPGAGYSGTGGRDFRPLPFSGAAELGVPLVFAGYGIDALEADHTDYAGLDVNHKIVLVLRGEPDTDDPSSPFYGEGSTYHAYFKTKAEEAYFQGAAGIVVVNPVGRAESAADFALLPAYALSGSGLPPALRSRVGPDFPALLSGSGLLVAAAEAWGVAPNELKAAADRGTRPASLGLPALEIRLSVARTDPPDVIPVRNVAGVLPGADENSYVIVGAHHDHLGMVESSDHPDGDTIFNGADDNASGVSVVLGAARALAGVDLDRSVVFATFSAEEHGLYGSSVLASPQGLDLTRAVLMVNSDMAGRNPDDAMVVYQGGVMPFRGQTLESIAADVGLPVQVVNTSFGGSDHLPFEMAGVPVVFPFGGFHEDYHGLDDEADRISYERLVDVTEFVVGIVEAAAGVR